MFSSNSSLEQIGKNISSVISDNLERSSLFIPIDKKAFIQSSESLSNQPRFEDWKVIKAQHLVAGKIETNNENISVEFRLFDVFAQKQIVERANSGLVHQERDVNDFITKTLELYKSESLRKKLGENGEQFVKEEFSWEKKSKALISFYDKILV